MVYIPAENIEIDIAPTEITVTLSAEEVEAGQYDKAIEFLANYKIFKGYNADDTGAEDLIQRYQMALFVARIATGWVEDEVWEDGPENWSEFSDIDVDPVNKYYGALSFANQKGIIEGYGNGKFGPKDNITRAEILSIFEKMCADYPWLEEHPRRLPLAWIIRGVNGVFKKKGTDKRHMIKEIDQENIKIYQNIYHEMEFRFK